MFEALKVRFILNSDSLIVASQTRISFYGYRYSAAIFAAEQNTHYVSKCTKRMAFLAVSSVISLAIDEYILAVFFFLCCALSLIRMMPSSTTHIAAPFVPLTKSMWRIWGSSEENRALEASAEFDDGNGAIDRRTISNEPTFAAFPCTQRKDLYFAAKDK